MLLAPRRDPARGCVGDADEDDGHGNASFREGGRGGHARGPDAPPCRGRADGGDGARRDDGEPARHPDRGVQRDVRRGRARERALGDGGGGAAGGSPGPSHDPQRRRVGARVEGDPGPRAGRVRRLHGPAGVDDPRWLPGLPAAGEPQGGAADQGEAAGRTCAGDARATPRPRALETLDRSTRADARGSRSARGALAPPGRLRLPRGRLDGPPAPRRVPRRHRQGDARGERALRPRRRARRPALGRHGGEHGRPVHRGAAAGLARRQGTTPRAHRHEPARSRIPALTRRCARARRRASAS